MSDMGARIECSVISDLDSRFDEGDSVKVKTTDGKCFCGEITNIEPYDNEIFIGNDNESVNIRMDKVVSIRTLN